MTRKHLIAMIVAVGIPVAIGTSAFAQTTQTAQTQTQDRIYGSQLMTAQERTEYQQRMRSLATPQERDQFRSEHHAQMQTRATERGMKLPDTPPAQGRGAGTGPRTGAGPQQTPGSGRGR